MFWKHWKTQRQLLHRTSLSLFEYWQFSTTDDCSPGQAGYVTCSGLPAPQTRGIEFNVFSTKIVMCFAVHLSLLRWIFGFIVNILKCDNSLGRPVRSRVMEQLPHSFFTLHCIVLSFHLDKQAIYSSFEPSRAYVIIILLWLCLFSEVSAPDGFSESTTTTHFFSLVQ